MTKETQKLSEILKGPEPMGAIEAVKQSLSAILGPMQDIGGQVWDGMKPSFDHGRAELAAVLYNGSGHVMYGHTSQHGEQEAPDHGLTNEAMQPPEQEQSRGGREM